jgi:predicted transposase YdaD
MSIHFDITTDICFQQGTVIGNAEGEVRGEARGEARGTKILKLYSKGKAPAEIAAVLGYDIDKVMRVINDFENED